MQPRYYSNGKEVLQRKEDKPRGTHLADCMNEATAKYIAKCMNEKERRDYIQDSV